MLKNFSTSGEVFAAFKLTKFLLNNNPNIILQSIDHQHNRDREMRKEFRRILHQRVENERLALCIIYDEVAAMPNFRNVNISQF